MPAAGWTPTRNTGAPAAWLRDRISAPPALDTRRPGVILGSCSPFYCAEDGCGLVAQRWLPTPRIRQPPRCDDAEPAWVAGGRRRFRPRRAVAGAGGTRPPGAVPQPG